MTKLIDLVIGLNKSWNWDWLSKNPNITFEDIKTSPDSPWNWNCLSSNPDITFEDVKANSDKPWDWEYLSRNPSITFEDIKANPDRPWDWDYLSQNPSITFEDVKANPDNPWNWSCLSSNKFKHDSDLQKIKIRKLTFIRRQNKRLNKTLKFNFWKLYYISKTREFCEWYYHPKNGGGKISKKKLCGFVHAI